MNDTIDLMSDSSERVHYPLPEYRVYAGKGRISSFRDMRAACHWHDDFEFCMVLSGRMRYYVGGETMVIEAGQGLFVNARQLHYNFAHESGDAEYYCVLIHPSLLCADAYLRDTYIAPIMDNGAFAYRKLDPAEDWARAAMEEIGKIWAIFRDKPAALGLRAQSEAYRLMELMYAHRPEDVAPPASLDRHMTALHAMIGFIQRSYAENISLNDIARAADVGKSSCCAIFRTQLRQTPTAYLTAYRLKKGRELLDGSSLTVTEIALATGFSAPSYFAEVFHRHVGMTPTEYREREE